MKRLFIIAALMSLIVPAHAGSYRVINFAADTIGTSTAEVTVVRSGIEGKVLAFSFYSHTNMTVRVETTKDIGLSQGSIRTISASTNGTAGGFYHTLSAQYLKGERLKMFCHSADSAAATGRGWLLLEK